MSSCLHRGSLLSLVLAMCVGCAPDETTPSGLEGELSTNFGEVVLTYSQPVGIGARERDIDEDLLDSTLSLSARFVHIRDIERRDERFLWEEDLPMVDVSMNRCQELEARSRRDQVLSGTLELLDAGDLTVQVDNQVQRVPDWNFPSVYGVVAGVVYGGDEPLGEIGFQPGSDYRLSSSGSEEIGPFEISLRAPNGLSGVSIGGIDVDEGVMTLESPGALQVRWEPDEDQGEVLVELSYAYFGNEQRWACRSREDGHLEIPSEIASRLWEAGITDPRIVIYRLRRQPFSAEGLDEAEALFVVTQSIPLQLP